MVLPTEQLRVTAAIHRAAQQHPNLLSTVDSAAIDPSTNEAVKRTWSQTLERVAKAAGGFRKLGLTDESRVAAVMLNSDKYLEAYYSIPMAGGIVVPINIRLPVKDIVETLNDCAAEFVLLDDQFLPMGEELSKSVPSLKNVIYVGEEYNSKDVKNLKAKYSLAIMELLINECKPYEDCLRGGNDTYGLFYTGGTTGKSKGVMLTHSNILTNAVGMVAGLKYDSESKYLHAAPMFHAADCASTFAITLVGGTHYFIPKFDPAKVPMLLEKFTINKLLLVPVMFAMLIEWLKNSESKFDLSSVHDIFYGASPMPEALISPIKAAFPNARLTQGYGMTETSPVITLLFPKYHELGNAKIRSVGQPAFWVEAKIVDTDFKEVPRGTVGEIVTRGGHVMKGYWDRPELTKAAIQDGWMHTGDGGLMDEEGFIFIADRIKDMIITGGENVYSVEVEQVLAKFKVDGVAAFSMVAVIGLPDEKFGERVAGVCVLSEQFKAAHKYVKKDFDAAVISYCKPLLRYKSPSVIEVIDEMPLSGAGKILKTELRKRFNTDTTGNVYGKKA